MRQPRNSRASSRHHRLALVSIAIATLAIVTLVLSGVTTSTPTMSFTELTASIDDGSVARVLVNGEHLTVTSVAGATKHVVIADEAARTSVVGDLARRGVTVEYESSSLSPQAAKGGYALAFLLVVAAAFLLMRQVRSRSVGHFQRHEPRAGRPGFEAVAGLTEAKRALGETVAFLRHPDRFSNLGARPPRGLLLTGQPGTGKTLLARCAAQEAEVPFLTCSGSSFQEMFVGVGAARIRKLFAEARAVAPCVVFIDEIDALGRSRGSAADTASSEHDRTLNQLLVEMDGFEATTGIVVMATTNRPDMLDSALVRPGRFDRQIEVPLPTVAERRDILDVHASGLALAADVDLARVAKTTSSFSGAELANLLNEAALLAVRADDTLVRPHHIDEARDRLLMGAERTGVLMTPRERHATAVHEAGHAAIAMTAPECDRVDKVSIMPRGRALGVTQAIPERDRVMFTQEFLLDRICMLLGGRAAEVEILGTMTAGASDDLERASELARRMVGEMGMGDRGLLYVSSKDTDARHAERVERDAQQILDEQLTRARSIVRHRRAEIDTLTTTLLEQDTLGRELVGQILPVRPHASHALRPTA